MIYVMSKSLDRLHHLLHRRVFFIVNVVVLCFLLLSFGRQWVRNASIESEIADLTRQKAMLEARNNQLLSLGDTIQTQYYLEKEGRLKYGLSKPGEQLVVVTDPASSPAANAQPTGSPSESSLAPSTNTTETPKHVGNPGRWWAYFFNKAVYQELGNAYGS